MSDRKPRFCVTKTLLGGEPDVNRRYICDTASSYAEILGFNIWMKTWTAEHNDAVSAIAGALNAIADNHPDVVDRVVAMLQAAVMLTKERP